MYSDYGEDPGVLLYTVSIPVNRHWYMCDTIMSLSTSHSSALMEVSRWTWVSWFLLGFYLQLLQKGTFVISGTFFLRIICLSGHPQLNWCHSNEGNSELENNHPLASFFWFFWGKGTRIFSITASRIRNYLPPALRMWGSPDTLHCHLNTHYFQEAFLETDLAPFFMCLRLGFC